jgi:DNA helicase II / ATP-dependent DNA helicase PcrA
MAVIRRDFGARTIQYDPSQRQAITDIEGPLLVVAGAGTGKTTVLTQRIAHLIREGHACADEILALTYTDNAAGEMLLRLERELGRAEVRGLAVNTFHAYANNLLIGARRDFRVLDDKQLWIFLRREIRRLKLNYFVRAARIADFLDDLLDFMRRCHDELVGPSDYAEYVRRLETGELPVPRVSKSKDADAIADQEAIDRCREIASVFQTVEEMLAERNLGTFGHMIVRANELLAGDPGLLVQARAHARFVLVDEFQDANFAQIKILEKLGDSSRQVFAVGDPDQGIYRFRGASSDAFELFQRHFPDSKLVVLNKNRRSTTPVLKCAHAVIARNPTFSMSASGARYRRTPLLSARDEEDPEKSRTRSPVEIVLTTGSFMEAADLVSTLIERRRRFRCEWDTMAVLYRSHLHRDEVAAELARNHIPFTIEGLNVMDTPEVRDLLACLRVVVSPADSAAWLRVAALPQFAVCVDELRAALVSLPRNSQTGLAELIPGLRTGAGLVEAIERAREEIAGKNAQLALFSLTGCFQIPRGPAVEALVEFARAWQESPLTATGCPGEFLEYLEYFREAGGIIPLPVRDERNAVKLMSVHGAKGLEFEHVFLLRAVSNSFPASYREPLIEFPPALRSFRSPASVDDKSLHEQEECRLFYVAMTRARDTLTLYGPFGRGKKEKTPPGYLRELLKNRELKPWLRQRNCREFQTEIFAAAGPAPPSRLAEWVGLPPLSDLSATLSASAIERYEVCPLQFKLEREWRIPAEISAALQYGASIHRVLLAYYDGLRRGRPLAVAELVERFRADLAAEEIADRYQHDLYERQGIDQLGEFLAGASRVPSQVLHTEEHFSVRSGSTNLVGRIDRIDRAGDNRVIITDYKTGKPKSQEDADNSLQLSLYSLAAREKWGYVAERLVFHNLEGNSLVTSVRSESQLEEARLRVEEVATKIAAGQFQPKPGFHCASCSYRLLCPKTEKLIPQFLAAAADSAQ